MYKKVAQFLYLLIIILATFNNLVKSDITNENELNTLWWIAIQYELAWDLSTGKVCLNKGIVCDSSLKTVKSLILNSTIPLGNVVPPPLLSTTINALGSTSRAGSLSTVTGTTDPTSTTSVYTIGTSGSSTITTDIPTTTTTSIIDPTSGTIGSSTSTSGSTTDMPTTATTTSGYTIGTSGSSTITTDIPTTTTSIIDPTSGTIGSSTSTSGSTTDMPTTATTSGYTIGTSGSSTMTTNTPTTTSGYTIGTSGSSTTPTTALTTSVFPTTIPKSSTTDVILPQIDILESPSFLQSRILQSVVSNQPTITFLTLPNITSLIINNITANNINILDYINQMTSLEYLEISNVQNINIIPDLFLFYCPSISTLIIRNIPAPHLSDVFFTKTDGPLTTMILDFTMDRFNWTETNSINNLYLKLNNASAITIDGFNWQQLQTLTIYTNAPISILNMRNLKNVSVFCTSSSFLSYDFSNSLMGSLSFKNCVINDSGLSFSTTNLTSLVFLDGSLSYTTPIVNLPPNLEILDIENSSLSKLSSSLNINNLKQLLIPINSVSNQLPLFTQLQRVNTSKNYITGSVPSTFCSTPLIDLSYNRFTSIPDCFECHWNSLASHWLTGNQYDLTPNSTFVCDFKLDVSNFNVLSVGETLDITGENLGWQTPTTTQGLNMVIPNSKFTYDFPPIPVSTLLKLQQISSTGSRILQFTPDQSVSIEWTYYNLEIFKVDFIQQPNRLLLNISGTFDMNGVVVINNSTYTSTPLFHLHEYITLDLPLTFKEGPVEIFIRSIKVSSPIIKSSYKRIFPTISSASIITPTNNQLTIYGKFYYSSGSALPIVSINNQTCTLISSNDSIIIVNSPTFSQGGYASISIDDNGFIFTSSKIVYYEKPKSNQCPQTCENGGTCIDGQCNCGGSGDYYGPTCSFKKPASNTYSLITNQTQPQATYSLSTVEFEFSLSSLEELDLNDNVIQKMTIDKWEYKEDKTNELGVSSIYYSNQSNVIVSVSVVVPSKSVNYEFAGITMNLQKDQVKVSLNISGWQYQSSLSTLRAVFISTSKSNIPQDTNNNCLSTNSTLNSQTDSGSNSLLSFTLKRNGAILFGSFIDRMISNGRIAISTVVDLGTVNSISYVGINMPQCNQCLLDPNYAVLVDPDFSSSNGNDGCGGSNSRAWVIPVAVVVPIVAVVALSVAGYVLFKKHFYVHRDGKSFRFSSRRKSKTKYNMDRFS
ncbi:hypothetical protein RB653_003068 [Dictyostelium firmibasis]|uniref:ComC supersandwich domain-containing protein n=1 Tax=Dictyostelium firmibasis TaxID=79012 RepID=A0AAN7U3X1_9MYCE